MALVNLKDHEFSIPRVYAFQPSTGTHVAQSIQTPLDHLYEYVNITVTSENTAGHIWIKFYTDEYNTFSDDDAHTNFGYVGESLEREVKYPIADAGWPIVYNDEDIDITGHQDYSMLCSKNNPIYVPERCRLGVGSDSVDVSYVTLHFIDHF